MRDQRERPKRQKGEVRIAVYLVLQRRNLYAEGEANVVILAAKLNRRGADEMVDAIPGTFVKKITAEK